MAEDLDKLRKEIDRLADELAALIERRAAQAKRIGELKAGAALDERGKLVVELVDLRPELLNVHQWEDNALRARR